jgi:hypothetical protein
MTSPIPPASRTLPIRAALDGSDALARLTARVETSRRRLDAVAPLFAAPMRPLVRAGPLDDTAWTLLAANGAVAAKLRQMVPMLERRLAEQGWPALAIRVRVLAGD